MQISRRLFLGSASASLLADSKPRVACVLNVWFPNSHADVFLTRLLDGYRLNGEWHAPRLNTVSFYVDQFPDNDMAREEAEEHGIRIFPTVSEAMRPDGKLVDAVAVIGEHGEYPRTPRGNFQYPRRGYFDQIMPVMRESRRVIPIYQDKYFANDWADAKHMYDVARAMRVPMLCGSTVPQAWRRPALEIPRGTRFTELVTTSYSDLEEHAYHGIELLQAMAERRAGGETGVERVRWCEGEDVWRLAKDREWPRALLDAALARNVNHVPPGGKEPPQAFLVRYRDGVKAAVLHVNAMTRDYNFAAQIQGQEAPVSTCFYIQLYVHNHWSIQVRDFEDLVTTRREPRPTERTLVANGIMLAGLESRRQGGKWIDTPELSFSYS